MLKPRRIEVRDGGGSPPRGRNPAEGFGRRGRKQDYAIGAPGGAPAGRRFAERADRSTGRINPPELPPREETDEPAIRRPERVRGLIGSGKRDTLKRIERTDPEACNSSGVRCGECQLLSIRRESKMSSAGTAGGPRI